MKTIPDMPAGPYAYFRYATAYAKAGALQEHINLVLEGGEWKLTGYFVRPPSVK
jgi:hypothetical protein